MATIHQQIEVAADPALVGSTGTHFTQWTHTGPGHLVCDELACVDAVRAGSSSFAPRSGRTTVVFRMGETRAAHRRRMPDAGSATTSWCSRTTSSAAV